MNTTKKEVTQTEEVTQNLLTAAPSDDATTPRNEWKSAYATVNGQQVHIRIPSGYMLATIGQLTEVTSAMEQTKILSRENARTLAAMTTEYNRTLTDLKLAQQRILEQRDTIELLGLAVARSENAAQYYKRKRQEAREETSQLRHCLAYPMKWLVKALLKRSIHAERRARHAETRRLAEEARTITTAQQDLEAVLNANTRSNLDNAGISTPSS